MNSLYRYNSKAKFSSKQQQDEGLEEKKSEKKVKTVSKNSDDWTKRNKSKSGFRFNRHQEKAKYDGRTKYAKPQYAFKYNYKYKHIDTSLPASEIAYNWLKNTQKASFEYLLDMTIRGDLNAVMHKTAGFIKR